jgi:hypothetical protein
LQGHGVPVQEHTSTTATLPLPTDHSAKAAVHLAQCSSGSSYTSCCTCGEVCVIY